MAANLGNDCTNQQFKCIGDLSVAILLFAYWVILHAFLSPADFFQNPFFSKNYFRNTIRASNSLDSDQARYFVGPDLDPNCLQKLSADEINRQRVKCI